MSILSNSIQYNIRTNDTWADDYASNILDGLDSNAVLFGHGDFDQGALSYRNLVLGHRRDVTIYNGKGILLSNRIFQPLDDDAATRNRVINKFINDVDRPVYYTFGLHHEFPVIDYGLYRKINKSVSTSHNQIAIDKDTIDYMNAIVNAGEPADAWQKMHYALLLNELCKLSIRSKSSQELHDELISGESDTMDRVCYLYTGRLELIDVLLNSSKPDLLLLDKLLENAESLKQKAILKSDISRLSYYRGLFYELKGDFDKANNFFTMSYNQWRHPDNPSLKKINL